MANMSMTKNPIPEQEPLVRNKNFDEVALGYTEEIAIDEAKRCLNCRQHPCVSGCPVNVRIPEFIAKVAEGEFERPTRSSPPPTACPPSAAASARRSISARASASAASRARASASAVSSATSPTGTPPTLTPTRRSRSPFPTATASPLSAPALPV